MTLSTRSLRLFLCAIAMSSALTGGPAHAQTGSGDDTRLRLDESLARQRSESERQVLEDAGDLSAVPATIEINGKTYTVANTVNEMGEALYIATARKQWADVQRFLRAYLALEGRDPMLVAYARGALARQRGQLGEAERQYRQLLRLQPGFVPGQLELARVQFENHEDRAARRTFETARAALSDEGEKAIGVRRTIDSFLEALRQRRGWQGSISIGPSYSTNINQSSASYTCLLASTDGTCLIDRKVPDPIKAAGINFEGSVSRRVPLGGHGGISGRALYYGDIYPGHTRYSQTTLTAQIGYDYRTARASVTVSPTYDIGTLGTALLYEAPGLRAEAMVNPTQTLALKAEVSRRWFTYHKAGYGDYDGALSEALLTGWKVLPDGWTLFGGPDFAVKDADSPVNAYFRYGARLGIARQFGQIASLLAFASYRLKDYRGYSELLEARRHDREQNYTATARFPALRFAGVTPSLLLRHSRVSSSIGWLYSYHNTTLAMRLEHVF